jgi:hypothetical protein
MREKIATKTDMSPEMADDQMTVEQWLAIRKEAGLYIDPETAEEALGARLARVPHGIPGPAQDDRSRVTLGAETEI